VARQLDALSKQLTGRVWTTGRPRVTLIGEPNAGKSSLFNALAASGAALVSAQAGTTRDYLTAIVDANGLEIELIDTAGVATSGQTIDRMENTGTSTIDSVARSQAIEQHRQADMQLVCVDASAGVEPIAVCNAIDLPTTPSITVLTKCDLNHADCSSRKCIIIETSSRTGLGLDQLRRAVRNALTERALAESSNGATISIRVRESLNAAINGVTAAQRLSASAEGDEFVAAEIRAVLDELGKIVGAVYTDDLLDRIFSRFCIGK
jgi:tRNA modification GTPase